MKDLLTCPSTPNLINSTDNVNNNLIVRKGDKFYKNDQHMYIIRSLLGTGSYGQVFLSTNPANKKNYAIKVLKNQNAYYRHGLLEIRILRKINEECMIADKNKAENLFVKMEDSFIYKNHLCIVLELLDKNLYEILQITGFRGFDHKPLKRIGEQIVKGLEALKRMNIVHCDLKPENILISNLEQLRIKIIDFGNAFENQANDNFYIQSRYYRAPEVMLGFPYDSGIDIWSFGCIMYELFIGHPLFPGKSTEDQLNRIACLLGDPPNFMLDHGIFGSKIRESMTENFNYVNMDRFTKKIFRKDTNYVENDKLYSLLIEVLKINPFERPSAFKIEKMPYLKDDKEEIFSIRRDSVYEIERNQPNPEPFDDKLRSESDYEYHGSIENKDNKNWRKYSVYDPNFDKENKRKDK